MTSKDIIKRLKADGWKKFGAKGDHEKFKHPIGTLRNIYRQAGWDWS